MSSEEAEEKKSSKNDIYAQVASGTAIIFVGKILGLGLGFLARSIPARLLGPEKYGSLALGWTVVSMIGFVALLGLRDGITRFVPRYDTVEEKKSILVTAVTIALPWSIFLMAVISFLSVEISTTLLSENVSPDVIIIFSLLIPLVSINKLILSYFRGVKNAKLYALVQNILNPGLRVVLISAAILAGYSISGAAIGWVLAFLCTLLAAVYLLYRETTVFEVESRSLKFSKILQFSLPLMISGSMGLVLNFGDNFLIGVFLESVDVGIYDPAFLLASLVTTGLTVFSYMFLPIFSELHDNESFAEMADLYTVVTKWIILVTVPVYLVFATFPGAVLGLLFGEAYTTGATVLVVLATGSLVNASVGLCVQGLVAIGATRYIMVTNIMAAILNLALNIILIPRFGITGAAIASATTTIMYNTFYTVRIYQVLKTEPIPKSIILPSVPPIVTALFLRRTLYNHVPNLVLLFLAGGVLAVVYFGSYVLFGAAEEADIELIGTIEAETGISLAPVKRILERGIR